MSGGWSRLHPFYRMVWADPRRRSRKLLQFGEVEAEGARDLFRAAELTDDPRLRSRFFAHAADELRHADLFRARGVTLRRELPPGGTEPGMIDAMVPGERGLDDFEVDEESVTSLLAFIHLSESAAFRSFTSYAAVLDHDPETSAIIGRIARDERGHMAYSLSELNRISGERTGRALWAARRRRLWKAYLRFAAALADRIAGVVLVLQYFVLLFPFAWAARRAAARDPAGWRPVPRADAPAGGQY